MEIIGDLWNEAIIRPMINSLVLLYYLLFSQFGLAIIVFTVIIRAIMIPMTLKQSRQMKAMGRIQPKMKALQEKYADDKARVSKETMRLYKDQGVNPIGCLGPMVIQFPIFIGLFWALRGTLATSPEKLVDLSKHLYSWLPQVNEAVPLDSSFLWLDLGKTSVENPVSPLLPLLVGGSMWLMQKMTTTGSANPQQESTQKMMLWMMPIMFGFFTFQFEAGLALYWIVSNILGIVVQGFVTGWGPIAALVAIVRPREPLVELNDAEANTEEASVSAPSTKEASINEDDRKDGKNVRRSNRTRSKRARGRASGSRNRHR